MRTPIPFTPRVAFRRLPSPALLQKRIYDPWAIHLRRSGNRRPEELLHHLGVRLAAGALHDLPHEEAEDAVLAVPELYHLIRMTGDDLIHCVLESTAVTHFCKALRG